MFIDLDGYLPSITDEPPELLTKTLKTSLATTMHGAGPAPGAQITTDGMRVLQTLGTMDAEHAKRALCACHAGSARQPFGSTAGCRTSSRRACLDGIQNIGFHERMGEQLNGSNGTEKRAIGRPANTRTFFHPRCTSSAPAQNQPHASECRDEGPTSLFEMEWWRAYARGPLFHWPPL